MACASLHCAELFVHRLNVLSRGWRATHLVFAHTFEEHFYPMSVAASDCMRASSSKAENPVTGMLQCLVRFAPFVERRTFSDMPGSQIALRAGILVQVVI